MTETADRDDDDRLKALFAAARAVDAQPSSDFLARLVATAEAAQPAPQRAALPAAPVRARRGWLAACLAALGGWPALGGLALASAAGFWIGVAPPAGLTALAARLAGQTVDVGLYGEDELLALLEG